MTSITTFAYGLTVRATDLITAAQAWTSLEPTFEFFDLLFLRKKKGTLQGRLSGSTREEDIIGKVPVEVWEEIRKWVVVIQMRDKEDEMLRQFVQPFQPFNEEDAESCKTRKFAWNDFMKGSSEGDSLWWLRHDGDFLNYLNGFISGLGESLEPTHRLLARFGLAHPLTRMITYTEDYFDLDAVSLVSLPIRTSTGQHSTITADAGGDSGPDEHAMIDVSLELPLDADSRFVRLIRTFNVEIVQVCRSILQVVKPSWKAKDGSSIPANQIVSRQGESAIKKEQVKVTNEIKPGWKLYTSCWCNW